MSEKKQQSVEDTSEELSEEELEKSSGGTAKWFPHISVEDEAGTTD